MKIRHNDDGSSTIELGVITKRIRAADGKWRTLTSLDGVTWALDAHRQRVRHNRGVQLHKAREAKVAAALDEKLRADKARGVTKRPVNLPDMQRIIQPQMLGKDKGKGGRRIFVRQKGVILDTNKAHKRKPADPKVYEKDKLKPVHYHRCHDRDHILNEDLGRKFPCMCDTPWKKRFCGGAVCLHVGPFPEVNQWKGQGPKTGKEI